MALEDKMKEAPEETGQLTDDEEDDLRIAVALLENIIDDGGKEIIAQAIKESNDPSQIIGQFIMQAVAQMSENLPEGVELSKRIYLAEGGVVEQISDYLQEQYGVSQEIMDRAEIYVASTAEQMAQAAAQNGVAGQPGQGPAAPQPGAPAPAAPAGSPVPQQGGVV